MSKSEKILITLVVLLVAGVIVVLTEQLPSHKSEELTFGFISSLTGDTATWGEGIKKGALLAQEEFNAKTQNKKVKLVIEDDGCDTAKGVSALQRVLLEKPAVIIATLCSSPTLAMVPIINEKKLPLISAGASSPELSGSSKYFFRLYPSDAEVGNILARFVSNNLNLKKAGIIYVNDEFGLGLRKGFKTTFDSLGGSVVADESFTGKDTTDFRTQLLKIKMGGAEVLFFTPTIQGFSSLVKQMNELNMQIPLLTDVTAETQEAQLIYQSIYRLYYASPEESTTERWAKVNQVYRAKYGSDGDLLVQLGYDSFMVTAEAVGKVGGASDKIVQYLEQLENWEGASGILTFNTNHDIQKKFFIKKIERGAVSMVEE